MLLSIGWKFAHSGLRCPAPFSEAIGSPAETTTVLLESRGKV